MNTTSNISIIEKLTSLFRFFFFIFSYRTLKDLYQSFEGISTASASSATFWNNLFLYQCRPGTRQASVIPYVKRVWDLVNGVTADSRIGRSNRCVAAAYVKPSEWEAEEGMHDLVDYITVSCVGSRRHGTEFGSKIARKSLDECIWEPSVGVSLEVIWLQEAGAMWYRKEWG